MQQVKFHCVAVTHIHVREEAIHCTVHVLYVHSCYDLQYDRTANVARQLRPVK